MVIGGVGNAAYMTFMPVAVQDVSPAGQNNLQLQPQQQNAPQNGSGRVVFYQNFDGDSVELSRPYAQINRSMPVPGPATAAVMTGQGAYTHVMTPEEMIPGTMFPQVTQPSTYTPANAYTEAKPKVPEPPGSGLLDALKPEGECETCANRKYMDGSDDPSVSYQTPTKISPNMAGAAVAAHEQEHVRNEQADAKREGREVVSQSVTIHYDTCPECGKSYVSGGTTRTMTAEKGENNKPELETDAKNPQSRPSSETE